MRCKHCNVEIGWFHDEWVNWTAYTFREAVLCSMSGKKHHPTVKEDYFDKIYLTLKNGM